MNKFIFHGVGQGLFYSGSLMDGEFNFVYDCGSESPKNMKNKIKTLPNKLNFVVISHLHNDHINGLLKLLEKCEVKKIYLPYFNFAGYESVLLSYMAINGIDVNSSVFKLLDYVYQSFGDRDEANISSDNLNKFLSNEDLQNSELKRHLENVKFMRIDKYYHTSTEIKLRWRFRFFSKIIDEKTIWKLNEEINGLLKESKISSVVDYIKTYGLDRLIKIYDKIFNRKKFNITSLILLHNPCHCCCAKQTLLTGDAEFDDDLNSRVERYLNSNIILQVPHHGADNGWLPLSEDIKMNSQKFVFSFGLNNNYHHPGSKCFVDIINKNWQDKICLVYENTDYIYYVNDCGCIY